MLFNSSKKILKEIKSYVDKNGCSVVATHNEHDGMPFAYSVGLANSGMPDVFIIGRMNPTIMMSIINNVHTYWKRNGVCYGRTDQVLQGFDVFLLPVETTENSFYENYAIQNIAFYRNFSHYNRRPVGMPRIVQVIWPDTEGKYPFDETYNKTRFEQKLFSDMNSAATIKLLAAHYGNDASDLEKDASDLQLSQA